MAKIAVALKDALARRTLHGGRGEIAGRILAQGDGWVIEDLICTSGPRDRSFEERHSSVSVAIVAAGSFEYRCTAGRELMTPGSLLLGNAGDTFECRHEHGAGDRCLSFRYDPEYFETLTVAGGAPGNRVDFHVSRLPPVREMSPLIARACASLAGGANTSWEELSVQLAARTMQVIAGFSARASNEPPSAMARVTRTLRAMEHNPSAGHTLKSLAREANLSPYHFLRTFERLTGVTPHQYLLRARLREAAVQLAADPARIMDIAFDCGFCDVSNFNHAFHAEFGVSPRVYRRQTEGRA